MAGWLGRNALRGGWRRREDGGGRLRGTGASWRRGWEVARRQDGNLEEAKRQLKLHQPEARSLPSMLRRSPSRRQASGGGEEWRNEANGWRNAHSTVTLLARLRG